MGSLIEAPDGIDAEMCQVVAQLVEILLGKLFRLLGIQTASHARDSGMANKRRGCLSGKLL